MVVLYGALHEPIATNYSSDGKTWLGWKVHALKSDLDGLTKFLELGAHIRTQDKGNGVIALQLFNDGGKNSFIISWDQNKNTLECSCLTSDGSWKRATLATPTIST